jgi:hypothetical protein
VDVRYAAGLWNVTRQNNARFEITQWPYFSDDFRIDNVSLSVGYIKPLYKPRKLKRARSKSVLRKITKDK